MKYSPELAATYSKNRENFNETDHLLMDKVKSIGITDKIIADLGCGDGRHDEVLKEMGANRVIGLDLSEKMIKIAKERTGNKEGLMFAVADGKHLPLESDSVDIVFSNFVVHYFPESYDIVGEISRILKSDGYFIGTFNITDADQGYEHLYNTKMPIRLGQGEESIVVHNLIKSRKEIEEALEKAGLEIIEEQPLNHFNAVVDESFPDKDHIHKHAMLFVFKKKERKG